MAYGYQYQSTGKTCSKGPQPGAVAFGKWAKKRWSLPLIGIFNCRPARSSKRLSTHGEGRGIDAHVHVRASEAPPTPAEKVVGDEMFALLIKIAPLIGVQALIWLDKRWDAISRRVKPYSGPFHGNHVHVELCWDAARNLTTAQLDDAAGAQEDDLDPERLKTFDQMAYAVLQLLLPATGRIELAVSDDEPLDAAKVAELVLAGLNPDSIAAAVVKALPKDQAKQVADELVKRLED